MVLVYLTNSQLQSDRYAAFLDGLEADHGNISYHNPDYWNGVVHETAEVVFTDHPAVIRAYQEAGIETRRITDQQRSIEELARLKGASIERKKGGWITVTAEDGSEKSFRSEDKVRSYLDSL